MNRDWIAGMDAMQRVAAPNSDCIALVNSGLAPAWYAKTPLHFCNHNLFRLDKNGNVMWQVKRFECGKSNWRQLLRRLKQEGGAAAESAVRQPFVSVRTPFVRRGRFHPLRIENMAPDDLSHMPQPDFVLIASTGNEWYEVDIDTGIATNVTPRPWAAHW